MPRLRVVALGGRLPGWAEEACAEYAKRMPRGYEVERITAKNVARKGNLVALDERGKDMTSVEFAAELQKLQDRGEPVTFILGGSYGLTDNVRAAAKKVVRLSSMVLPHELCRVVFLEQLYRATEINKGSAYHH